MNPKTIFNSGMVNDLRAIRTVSGATLAKNGIKMDEAQEFFSQEWNMNFWAVKIDGEWKQATGLEMLVLNKIS